MSLLPITFSENNTNLKQELSIIQSRNSKDASGGDDDNDPIELPSFQYNMTSRQLGTAIQSYREVICNPKKVKERIEAFFHLIKVIEHFMKNSLLDPDIKSEVDQIQINLIKMRKPR